jgi:hypothetical protein
MTAPAHPPLVGFNNNLRYRGMSFHIQTEDSGVGRPHIITHLFADGGRGIKTMRVDYSKHSSDYRTVVQHMMREQHRAMASDLRKGRVDAIIDGLTPRQTPHGGGRSHPLVASTGGRGREPRAARASARVLAEPKPMPRPDATFRASAVADEKALVQAVSGALRAANPTTARAWPKLSTVFAALPPDSLDRARQ